MWGGVVEAMAQVDALCSLAAAANDAAARGPVCRPSFVEPLTPQSGASAVRVRSSALHPFGEGCAEMVLAQGLRAEL